jgi:hypothetical protein
LISVVDVLRSISDDKGLVLFNTIALANCETENQIRKMGLTTKQYYSRISKLTKADLIRRKNRRYSLTLLGKVVYDAHTTLGNALKNYWKLKAIESIEMSPSVSLPKDDLAKIVDTLIDNHQIKDIVLKTFLNLELSPEDCPQQLSTAITNGTKIKVGLKKVSVKQIK